VPDGIATAQQAHLQVVRFYLWKKYKQNRTPCGKPAKELALPARIHLLVNNFSNYYATGHILKDIFGQNPSKHIKSNLMLSIGKQIRKLREDSGLPLRKVAAELDIDQSILSKIERGERKASRDQIIQIAKIFNADEKELLINYLSDKVIYELADESLATDALKVAEKKIKYLTKNRNGKQ